MANRPLDEFFIDQTLSTMPTEHDGHTCIYAVDQEDKNFKVCIECGRVRYRSDDEIIEEYGNKLQRSLEGDDDGA